ncbi:MAG: hypothetical protein HZA58_07495 [Acidimicrobiia bacterium]|nr:hypothetical protein [Acidimicrobiia bacterium]
MNRTSFFKIILILVAINAAIGIFALVGGELGETGGKILGTSLLATMGAVLALMCAPAASARRAWWWPMIGIAAALTSAAMFIVGVWAEPGDVFFKVAGSVLVIAVTSALISLLSAWPGSGRLAWVRGAATVLALIAAALVITLIWQEDDVPEFWGRGFGIVMVLLAAAAIATPVVHRMTLQTAPAPFTHCPFCGSAVTGLVGRKLTCPSCGRAYEVEAR